LQNVVHLRPGAGAPAFHKNVTANGISQVIANKGSAPRGDAANATIAVNHFSACSTAAAFHLSK
jgi:hypothetical protein